MTDWQTGCRTWFFKGKQRGKEDTQYIYTRTYGRANGRA